MRGKKLIRAIRFKLLFSTGLGAIRISWLIAHPMKTKRRDWIGDCEVEHGGLGHRETWEFGRVIKVRVFISIPFIALSALELDHGALRGKSPIACIAPGPKMGYLL